jgi:uncharacterized protein DUF4105
VQLACLVVTVPATVRAEQPPQVLAVPPPLATSSRTPTLTVLTFGPGDETFSKFGHDALWIHDPRQPARRRDLVFNYGTFRFNSPWLILDFLEGRLSYWLSATTLERTVASYRSANRSVNAQELDLSDAQARSITDFLFENVKEENAHYRYDYYRDNCATRIRDVLDRHLDGALSAASRGPAAQTYRDHTRRLTVGSPLLFFALDLALGPLIDRPVSEWGEMFLPARLAAKLDQLDSPSGKPLVRRRFSLFEAERPPPLEAPPGFRWGWLLAGIAIGAALFASGRARARWARLSSAAGLGAVGLLGGFLGVLLLVLWLLTDHEVTYWNANVLTCPVWALGIVALARDYARARPRYLSLMMRLVAAAAVSSCVALLLRAALPYAQQDGPALAFFLPQWLGATLAVWVRAGRPLPRWLGARPGNSKPGDAARDDSTDAAATDPLSE